MTVKIQWNPIFYLNIIGVRKGRRYFFLMLPDTRKGIALSKGPQASSVFLADDRSFVEKYKHGVKGKNVK